MSTSSGFKAAALLLVAAAASLLVDYVAHHKHARMLEVENLLAKGSVPATSSGLSDYATASHSLRHLLFVSYNWDQVSYHARPDQMLAPRIMTPYDPFSVNLPNFPVYSTQYQAYGLNIQSTPFTMHYQQINPTVQFWRRKRVSCAYDPEDEKVMEQGHANRSATPFIVINEARSGSSWLQEISQMHPGIKVQFELDLEYGPSALQCKQCHRPGNPDTKHPERIPPKRHPPEACGFTIFGSSNNVQKVREVAEYASGKVVILLRRNHVAHAISGYRHFQKIPRGFSRKDLTVPWSWSMLDVYATQKKSAYDKLVSYIGAGRPTHIIFYEDMKARVEDVWKELQAFLEVPPVTIPDIREAEAKSSSKPSVEYLDYLKDIRAAAAGSEWEAMLNDPQYDEKLDFGAEFARLCSEYGPGSAVANGQVSWRGGKCQ